MFGLFDPKAQSMHSNWLITCLIPLLGCQLNASPSWAETSKSRHPCLEKKSAQPLPAEPMYQAPADIGAAKGPTWLLDGIIIEHLPTKSLAQQKATLINKALSEHAYAAFAKRNIKPDRRGRHAAFLGPKDGSDLDSADKAILLQSKLAEQGLARIDVDGLSLACAKRLLQAERKARQQGIGLWKAPTLQPQSATGLHLSAIVSTYQVIHGKVQTVTRKGKGTSYLNFGSNWKKDFTVTLSEKSLARWEAEHKSLEAVKNAYIYVRGWVETRGGPLIRVHHPAQLWQETPPK